MTEKTKHRNAAIAITVLFTYLGYLVGGCVDAEGQLTFKSVLSRLPEVLNKPFANYWSAYSIQSIFYGLLLGVYLAMYYYFSRKKWMWGKEQGSAEWMPANELTKKLTPSKKEQKKEPEYIRILSQNLRISMNDVRTHLNNNILLVAGPGKGKSHQFNRPNILLCLGSMGITDPKKELLRTCGKYLKAHGYEIKVLDLIDFELSDLYNPFAHIQSEEDIPELVEMLWKSMEDPKAQKGEPIWDDSAKSLIEGLCYYMFLEMEEKDRTFRTLIRKLTELSLDEKSVEKMKHEMLKLRRKNPDHPAAVKYLFAMNGAADTVKSVLFSATGRLAALSNEKLLKIFDGNTIDFKALGMGYEHDRNKKTALFFCIPDGDTRWNFVVSIAYMQACRELYYEADHHCADKRGKLPIPVTFWLDEFRNVPLPNTFPVLLSTMRGRNISAVITLQDPSQLEELYEKEHKTIRGNCDVTVYMGSAEHETHKWVSEMLGKATIDKRSTGRSYGLNGNDSRTDDVLGRELMTPDEVGKLPVDKQIVFISGYAPILDTKFQTGNSANFREAVKLGDYIHHPDRPDAPEKKQKSSKEKGKEDDQEASKILKKEPEPLFERLSEEELEAYREEAEAGAPVILHRFDLNAQQPFMIRRVDNSRMEQLERFKGYREEQLEIIRQALERGCSIDELDKLLHYDMTTGQIRAVISGFLNVKL